MEQIYLKDICDLDNGYAFKSDDYVDISNTLNCRMSNIRPDGSFDIMYNAKYLPDEYSEKYKDYLLKDGDLIIAMTDMAGDPKILGVPTVVDTKGYNLLLNQRVGKLRFIKDGVDADYLKLALQSKNVRSYLKRFAGGGVQLNVSKKDILNSPIQMRTEEEQAYIVSVFRKLKRIINQRRNELELLDDLIKARFVELFGDPVSNPLGWEQVTLKDVAVGKLSYGSGASATEYDGECRYIRITDITDNGELNSDVKSPDKYDEKYLLHDGDILFARSGATVGKTFRYSEDKHGKGIYAGYLIRLIPNQEKVLPDYVFYYTKTEYYASFVKKAQRAVAQPNINAQEYGDLIICVPSINLQKEFMEFVEQVDKSKVVVQKALDEARLLFDSLMQRYFG